MAIQANDDFILVSEGLLGFDNLFEDNNFGIDIDAVEIVSIDVGNGVQAVGAGVATVQLDLGTLSVGNVGVAGQNISFDAGSDYDFLSFGQTRDATFTYVVRDANGLTDSATVTIQIFGLNDQPDAVDDAYGTAGNAPFPFLETATLSENVIDNDSDIDALDTLSVTAVNGGGIGGAIALSNGTLNMGASGAFTYVYTGADLAAGATFTETFDYTITDSAVFGALSDTATVTIVVTGANGDPIAVNDSYNVNQNALLNEDVTPGAVGQDSDPDGDTLSVTAVNGGGIGGVITLASGAEITMSADGSFNYDQNGVFSGLANGATAQDSFQYTISDGNGGTDTATATITVTGVNNDPVAVDDAFSVNEGAALSRDVTPGTAGQDNDSDGDTLTVTAVNGGGIGGTITLASGAQVVMSGNGSFSYNQNGAFSGLAGGVSAQDSFQYTISDGNGGTDTATARVTINGVNDQPIAVDDSFSVGEDASVSGDVTPGTVGQDSDPDGDTLSVTAVNGGGIGGTINLASGAQLQMNLDGTFDYDTNGAFNGLKAGETTQDSFQYTISDGNGGTDTATATVTINGANDAPTAVDDAFGVNSGVGLTQDVTPGTVGQDSDPDGDVLTVTAVNGGGIGSAINLASGASVTMNGNGTFSYNQNGAFNGLAPGATAQDSFQYTISDGNGGTDTATATITVSGIDNPPVITNLGADLLIGCKTLLSFNLLNAVDPEGSGRSFLTYTVQSVPGTGGSFIVLGKVLQAGDTFTQGDIHRGVVSFVHDEASAGGAFNLGLTVTDKSGATTAPFDFTVNVKAADEVLIGDNGANNLFGGNGDSSIKGLGGNDGLFGHGGDDCLRGGDGDDGLYAHGGDDVISGGRGNDLLDGNDGNDRLFGDAGDDMVWGNNGNDVMSGGNGNDGMAGGDGDDIIYGDGGDDMICGNAGDDFIFGDGGDDVLAGDIGDDILMGGNGEDILYGNAGNDFMHGGKGDDLMTGDGGLDRMIGGRGNDEMHGGEDRDVVVGGSGDDIIFGDGGNDVMVGGAGNDRIYGGAGKDVFIFNVGLSGNDRIEDFNASDDFIRLLNGGPSDFAALLPDLQQVGFDTVIDFGGSTLTIAFTDASSLNATDFHFFS